MSNLKTLCNNCGVSFVMTGERQQSFCNMSVPNPDENPNGTIKGLDICKKKLKQSMRFCPNTFIYHASNCICIACVMEDINVIQPVCLFCAHGAWFAHHGFLGMCRCVMLSIFATHPHHQPSSPIIIEIWPRCPSCPSQGIFVCLFASLGEWWKIREHGWMDGVGQTRMECAQHAVI